MQGAADFYDLKDEAQAKEYLNRVEIEYKFQCYHEKRADGCHRLGSFLETITKDFPAALKVFENNCIENKYGGSCFKLGMYSMIGKACKKNNAQALEHFNKACDLKDGRGCHNAALMYQEGKTADQKKDFKKSEECLIKGCEYKDLPSCNRLSGLYLQGKEGVPKNMELAFKYALIGCESDNPYACANISRMYKLGDGVEQSSELAEQFKQRAKNLYDSTREPMITSGDNINRK